MKTDKQTTPFLALVVPGTPSPEEAAKLLRREFSTRGQFPWSAAEIEVFPGRRESLLLARPAREQRMYISTVALGVLAGYFDMEGY